MPTAIALHSFDHSGPVRKGATVEFDQQTLDALRRSGLVGPNTDAPPPEKPVPPVPTVGSLGKAPKPKPTGRKSAASRAVQASTPLTLPPPLPGDLPPPLPVE